MTMWKETQKRILYSYWEIGIGILLAKPNLNPQKTEKAQFSSSKFAPKAYITFYSKRRKIVLLYHFSFIA